MKSRKRGNGGERPLFFNTDISYAELVFTPNKTIVVFFLNPSHKCSLSPVLIRKTLTSKLCYITLTPAKIQHDIHVKTFFLCPRTPEEQLHTIFQRYSMKLQKKPQTFFFAVCCTSCLLYLPHVPHALFNITFTHVFKTRHITEFICKYAGRQPLANFHA